MAKATLHDQAEIDLTLAGLQLAIRTDRLDALVMGGFPPVDGPYAEMMKVTDATHELSKNAPAQSGAPVQQATPADGEFDWEQVDWDSVEPTTPEPVARQFVTMYRALQDFDDSAAQATLTIPRLCVVGSEDSIVYSERWGGVTVDIAGPVVRHADELRAGGWDVEILDGLDHLTAMKPANVAPILRPWLERALTRR